jgi:hypothetical protein
MGWRDGPSGDDHPHLDRLPSSKPRNENDTCTATTRYMGYTECVLPEGHRGDHEDVEGVTWPDEDAIY